MSLDRYRDISELKRIKRLSKIKPKMSLQEAILFCIENNFKMDIMYSDGNDKEVLTGYRNISPAALGKHRTTGNKVVRAFLNEGASLSKKSPNWRLFRLDRIKQYNIYYNKTRVGSNKLYRMDDQAMSVIYSEIEKSFKQLLG